MPFNFFAGVPQCCSCGHSTHIFPPDISTLLELIEHPHLPLQLIMKSVTPSPYNLTLKRFGIQYKAFLTVFTEIKQDPHAGACEFYEASNIQSSQIQKILNMFRKYQYVFIGEYKTERYVVRHLDCLQEQWIKAEGPSPVYPERLLFFFFVPVDSPKPKLIKSRPRHKKACALLLPAPTQPVNIGPFDSITTKLAEIKHDYFNIQLNSPFLKRYNYLQQMNIESCIDAIAEWEKNKNSILLFSQRQEIHVAKVAGLPAIEDERYILEPNLAQLYQLQQRQNRELAELLKQLETAYKSIEPEQLKKLLFFFASFFALPLPAITEEPILLSAMNEFCATEAWLHNLALALAKTAPDLDVCQVGTGLFMREKAADIDLMIAPKLMLNRDEVAHHSVNAMNEKITFELRARYYPIAALPKRSTLFIPTEPNWLTQILVARDSTVSRATSIDVACYSRNQFNDFVRNMENRLLNIAAVCHYALTGNVFIHPQGVEALFANTVDFIRSDLMPFTSAIHSRTKQFLFKCWVKVNGSYKLGIHLNEAITQLKFEDPLLNLWLGVELLNHTHSRVQLAERYRLTIFQALQKLDAHPWVPNFDPLFSDGNVGYVLLLLSCFKDINALRSVPIIVSMFNNLVRQFGCNFIYDAYCLLINRYHRQIVYRLTPFYYSGDEFIGTLLAKCYRYLDNNQPMTN